MGELGAISGKIQREVEILRKLNDALLILEIDTLGLHAELNISPDDVTKSQDFMMEFADRLCSVLKHKSLTIDLQPIIHHFQSGMKPVEDWIEDLEDEIKRHPRLQYLKKGRFYGGLLIKFREGHISSLIIDESILSEWEQKRREEIKLKKMYGTEPTSNALPDSTKEE